MAVMAAMPVAAQEPEKVLEEVVVTGIRSSLKSAEALKRDANQFKDAIVAEDIGKLPDNNIAEALQRVTGVQISRTNGEGSFVSLRGLDQTFTQVTVNGQEIATARSNQTREDGVAFRQIASSVANVIEVIKSPTAKLDEGGIGGTVNIIKRRPLELEKSLVSVTLGGRSEEDSEGDDVTPEGSMFVNYLFNDRLGVSFGADYSERDFFRHQAGLNRQDRTSIDTNGDGADDAVHFRRYTPEVKRNEFESYTLSGTLEFRPTDNLTLYADGTLSQEDFSFERSQFELRFRGDDVDGARSVVDPATGIVTDLAILSFGDRARAAAAAGETDTQITTYALGADWDISDRWNGKFEYASSKTDYETVNAPGVSTDFANAGDPTPGDPDDVIARLVFSGGGFEFRDVLYDFSDPENFEVPANEIINGSSRFGEHRNEGEQQTVSADFTFDLDGEGANSIQFGAKFQTAKESTARIRFNQLDDSPGRTTPFQQLVPSFGDLHTQSTDGIRWTTFASDSLFAAAHGVDGIEYEGARSHGRSDDFTDSDRDILALYGMLNFSNDSTFFPFRGNLGLRYVDTETTVSSFTTDTDDTRRTLLDENGIPEGFTPVTIKRDYLELLPSLNVAFDLTENIVGRFAVARVMERPTIRDLAPYVRVSVPTTTDPDGNEILDLPEEGDVVFGAGSAGNPDLDPFIANQFDIGAEYYHDHGSVTLGFFFKDVSNFIAEETDIREVTSTSAIDPTTQVTFLADFDTPINAGAAEIYGFEIGVSQELTFLPIDGFGIVANYTRTEVDTELGVGLPGTSENTYNIIAYYENKSLGVRAAYNYRDAYPLDIATANEEGSAPLSFDDLGLLDISAYYKITEDFQIQAAITNVTDEINETEIRAINEGLADFSYEEETRRYGRAYTFSFSYTF